MGGPCDPRSPNVQVAPQGVSEEFAADPGRPTSSAPVAPITKHACGDGFPLLLLLVGPAIARRSSGRPRRVDGPRSGRCSSLQGPHLGEEAAIPVPRNSWEQVMHQVMVLFEKSLSAQREDVDADVPVAVGFVVRVVRQPLEGS